MHSCHVGYVVYKNCILFLLIQFYLHCVDNFWRRWTHSMCYGSSLASLCFTIWSAESTTR